MISDNKKDIELPKQFNNYSDSEKKIVLLYLSNLNEFEYKAYIIAKNYLGTSFDLLKSNGYLKWNEKN